MMLKHILIVFFVSMVPLLELRFPPKGTLLTPIFPAPTITTALRCAVIS